jgi:hypothetical protein
VTEALAARIDSPNFKNAVARQSVERGYRYGQVWPVHAQLQRVAYPR